MANNKKQGPQKVNYTFILNNKDSELVAKFIGAVSKYAGADKDAIIKDATIVGDVGVYMVIVPCLELQRYVTSQIDAYKALDVKLSRVGKNGSLLKFEFSETGMIEIETTESLRKAKVEAEKAAKAAAAK